MRRTAWVVTEAMTAAVVVGGARIIGADDQENSDRGRGKQCNEATVRGDYGIQIQGTRPGPGGLIESVIGIVLATTTATGASARSQT
jgi:hypothetical protein